MTHQQLVEAIKLDLNSISSRRYYDRNQAILYQLGLCMSFIAREIERDNIVKHRWNRMTEHARSQPRAPK